MEVEHNKKLKINSSGLFKHNSNNIVTMQHNEPSILPTELLKLAEESLPKLSNLLNEKEWYIYANWRYDLLCKKKIQ